MGGWLVCSVLQAALMVLVWWLLFNCSFINNIPLFITVNSSHSTIHLHSINVALHWFLSCLLHSSHFGSLLGREEGEEGGRGGGAADVAWCLVRLKGRLGSGSAAARERTGNTATWLQGAGVERERTPVPPRLAGSQLHWPQQPVSEGNFIHPQGPGTAS